MNHLAVSKCCDELQTNSRKIYCFKTYHLIFWYSKLPNSHSLFHAKLISIAYSKMFKSYAYSKVIRKCLFLFVFEDFVWQTMMLSFKVIQNLIFLYNLLNIFEYNRFYYSNNIKRILSTCIIYIVLTIYMVNIFMSAWADKK